MRNSHHVHNATAAMQSTGTRRAAPPMCQAAEAEMSRATGEANCRHAQITSAENA